MAFCDYLLESTRAHTHIAQTSPQASVPLMPLAGLSHVLQPPTLQSVGAGPYLGLPGNHRGSFLKTTNLGPTGVLLTPVFWGPSLGMAARCLSSLRLCCSAIRGMVACLGHSATLCVLVHPLVPPFCSQSHFLRKHTHLVQGLLHGPEVPWDIGPRALGPAPIGPARPSPPQCHLSP